MPKNLKKILTPVLTFGFLAVLVIYVERNWDQFQDIQLTSPWLLVVAGILIAINLYSNGKVVDTAIEPHGIKLSKTEIYGLSVLTRFLKLLAPTYAAISLRAVYFKKKYDVSYAKFSSSLFLSSIFQFVVSGLVVATIYIVQSEHNLDVSVINIGLILLLVFLILLYLPIKTVVRIENKIYRKFHFKIVERLIAATQEYEKVRAHPKIFLKTLLYIADILIVTSLTTMLYYKVVGVDVSFVQALFISAITSWTMIFSITPAGLGVREGLMVLGASVMGIAIPETLAVALLNRLVTFVTVTILATYFAPKILHTSLGNIASYGKKK